jgi:hypothetical protein
MIVVVLYSTHQTIFLWEKIEKGKSIHSTPGMYISPNADKYG